MPTRSRFVFYAAVLSILVAVGCPRQPTAHPPLPGNSPSPSITTYVLTEVLDEPAGLQSQVDELVRVAKTRDQSNWQVALKSFSLPDPDGWLKANFSSEYSAQLSENYAKVRDGHLSHISWVIGHHQDAPNFRIRVEQSEMPRPVSEAGFESLLARPAHPISVQNFRFTPVADSGSMPPSWVSSFIYANGHFRVVGGTYPFWAEKLTPLRGPMSLPASTIRGMTVQGIAYQHDQKGGRIIGVVQLRIKVEHDGRVSDIKVLSGDKEFIEDAKNYIMAAHFPVLPNTRQLANAQMNWDFEVAFFKPKD
jgi:hypothetical protein